MKYVKKINEFIDEGKFYFLIEKAETTPSSDPIFISQRESYRKVVEIGEKIIPYLIERKSYLWNMALKELTGVSPIGETSSEISDFWQKWAIENGYKK